MTLDTEKLFDTKRGANAAHKICKYYNMAEVQMTYSYAVPPAQRPKVTSSKDAAELFKAVWSDKIEYLEEFLIIPLNRANRSLGWFKVSMGGTCGTVVDPKVIFQVALKCNASSIILAHNHPSGNLQPSEADIRLTKKIKDAATFLDMMILDHLILDSEFKFYSFADEGKL